MANSRSIVAGLGCAALSFIISAAGAAETKVTTYVIKVQEEREQTRWTLTEWLRIKERMRMMDLWLAMFSDPKKDKFRPELMLSYGMTRGTLRYTANGQSQDGSINGTSARVQLWLTNLVSSTIGVRTLNIDLGFEGYRRQTGNFTLESPDPANGENESSPALAANRKFINDYYSGNLRIFGRNIQDSSLVLKYGKYITRDDITRLDAADSKSPFTGSLAAAELQLYLFRWLGAEGNYIVFNESQKIHDLEKRSGSYYDYLLYIEISLLRLMGGFYQEEWDVTRTEKTYEIKEKGMIGGLKIQL